MKIRAFFKKLRGIKDEEVKATAAPASAAPVAVPGPQPKVQAKPSPAKVIPVRQPQEPTAPVSPLSLKGGAKTQSDWLLLQIGKTGRAFITEAEKHKLTAGAPAASSEQFVRHDMTAALLGYGLVLTAYHFHQDVHSLEALRSVRTAMTGMLHRAVDITVDQLGKKELRARLLASAEDQFKAAEAEVGAACAKLRAQAPEPFTGFYAGLLPAFGAQENTKDLHQRFASILQELYGRIETNMAARNHQITG